MSAPIAAASPRLSWTPRRTPHVTAVEPDERYADSCADLPRTELIQARIENVALAEPASTSFIPATPSSISPHPSRALKDHARVLKPGGLLVLDAPNIALIGGDDILEEWFIDKHLYHFSDTTLGRMIEAAGFTIVEQPDPEDRINLLFVARKTRRGRSTIAADPIEVRSAQA